MRTQLIAGLKANMEESRKTEKEEPKNAMMALLGQKFKGLIEEDSDDS